MIKTITISASDFSGGSYQNSLLIGKTPMIDFNIWTLGGSGTLLTVNDGYTFASLTGTITADPFDYLILINNSPDTSFTSYGCQSCYVTTFPSCTDSGTVSAQLQPNQNYYTFVEDKFSNVYVQGVTTNGSGAFEIDFTAYPESLFTPDSGFFEMTISESSAFSTDELMIFNDNYYNCIIFSFVKTTAL